VYCRPENGTIKRYASPFTAYVGDFDPFFEATARKSDHHTFENRGKYLRRKSGNEAQRIITFFPGSDCGLQK
jgi:hypothetical protein